MLTVNNLLRVIAIAAVVYCGIHGTAARWWVPWVPLATVAAAAVVARLRHRVDRERMNEAAEQVYFLGYVSTIAAFAAAMFSIYRAGRLPEQPTTLLLMGSIALATTVVGLVLMTALKELAATFPGTNADDSEVSRFVVALHTLARAAELATATQGLGEFIERKDKLLGDLDHAVVEAQNLSNTLRTIQSQLSAATQELDAMTSSATESRRNVEEMDGVLERFATSLAQRIDGAGTSPG